MPTYQYACTDCGHELEVVQSFTDDALTVCPDCSGTLRKLFGKNKNTGVARLVTIAAKRAVAEAAQQELAETKYAPVEEDQS